MRRYLFVDDNRALAENLAEIATDGGASCQVASGGAEAVARVRAERFDAVVTDMRMPGMGGAELVHAVRRIDPGLPAIVLTAHAGDADLASARREGLLAVLAKPASIPRLLALLGAARRDGVVLLLEDEDVPLDALTEALRDRGFATIATDPAREDARPGPARPFVAITGVKHGGGSDGPASRTLATHFPGIPLVSAIAHPTGLAATLDAVERIHGARTDTP